MGWPTHLFLEAKLFAAVANNNDGTISVYQVSLITGAFTPVSTFAAGAGTNEIAFSPVASGNLFAAAVNFATNNVSVYTVNQASGVFTQVSGSPFASGTEPDGIAFSPLVAGGLFAATGNFGSNNATVYQVNLVAPTTPSISKSFSPNHLSVGASSILTITVTNADPAASTTLSAPFTDNLPTGLVISGAASTTCAGSVSTTSSTVTLAAGAVLPANSSCTISVPVSSSSIGIFTNTIPVGALQTTPNGNNAFAATAILTVGNPSISQIFSPREICLCDTSTLIITLSNPLPAAAQLTQPFVNTLPYELDIRGKVMNTCGGSLTIRGSTVTLLGASNSCPRILYPQYKRKFSSSR